MTETLFNMSDTHTKKVSSLLTMREHQSDEPISAQLQSSV